MREPQGCTREALQDAIDNLPPSGGTIWVPNGVYDFGKTPLVIREAQHRVQLLCESGTLFWYRGDGAAIEVGGDDGNTEGFRCSGCEISLSGNEYDGAVCLRLTRSFWATLQDMRFTSDNGAPVPRQYGLAVSGGSTSEAGFSAYNLVMNPAVIGSFRKGIWFGSEIAGGPSTGDRSNSNQVLGGSVYCGAQDRRGSVGVHIDHGDTNRIWGVDHDSLEIGTLVEGHANQVNARYENIDKYAIQITSSSMGSFIFGSAVPLNEWKDEGYETQYILTSQGGVNGSMLTDMGSRYSTTLTPRYDQPAHLREGMAWFDGNTGSLKVYGGGRVRTVLTD